MKNRKSWLQHKPNHKKLLTQKQFQKLKQGLLCFHNEYMGDFENDIYFNQSKAMGQKTNVIRVTLEIELKYNPDSPEFKKAISDYNECIEKDTSENDFIQRVAAHIARYGIIPMAGVGIIAEEGIEVDNRELYSGITVTDSQPMIETQIVDYNE